MIRPGRTIGIPFGIALGHSRRLGGCDPPPDIPRRVESGLLWCGRSPSARRDVRSATERDMCRPGDVHDPRHPVSAHNDEESSSAARWPVSFPDDNAALYTVSLAGRVPCDLRCTTRRTRPHCSGPLVVPVAGDCGSSAPLATASAGSTPTSPRPSGPSSAAVSRRSRASRGRPVRHHRGRGACVAVSWRVR